jgi:hypothetical protein
MCDIQISLMDGGEAEKYDQAVEAGEKSAEHNSDRNSLAHSTPISTDPYGLCVSLYR